MEWYVKVLRQYDVFKGRARRREYWMFTLIHVIIMWTAMFIDKLWGVVLVDESFGIVTVLYLMALFIPTLAVTVRRLHDIDKSGKWVLIMLIPVIGHFWLIFLLAIEGTDDNRYGINPKR